MKNITVITNKVISAVCLVLIMISATLVFGSCSKKHRYTHSEDMISKIEIVEYDNYSLRDNAIVLAEIPNCKEFFAELE